MEQSRRDFLKGAGVMAAGAAALVGASGLTGCTSGTSGGSTEKPKYECDVVVAGAGIGGLAAGVSALEAGSKTVMVEASNHVGGTSRFAAGGLGLRFGDDWQTVLKASPMTDPVMGEFVCNQWASYAEWIDGMGLPTEPMSKTSPYLWMGGKRPSEQGGKGYTDEYLQKFGDVFNEMGGTTVLGTRVVDLVTDDKGLVSGVVAEDAEGRFIIKAKAVIIATGGWQMDKEMCTKYIGRHADLSMAQCVPYLDGAGIKMAQKLGARLSRSFGSFYGHAQPWPMTYFKGTDTPEGYEKLDNIDEMNILFYGTTPNTFQNYGILINTNGRRFVNEQLLSSIVNQEIMQQVAARAYLLIDQSIRDSMASLDYTKALVVGGDRLDCMKERGMTILEANTLDELADMIHDGTVNNVSFNKANMMDTISGYNAAVEAGTTETLEVPHKADHPGMKSVPLPLATPPFYAIPLVAGIMATFGGLDINLDAQVIAEDTNTIPGLYAIPCAAGGIMNTEYWCVMSGNSIFGRVAGQTATAYAKSLKA